MTVIVKIARFAHMHAHMHAYPPTHMQTHAHANAHYQSPGCTLMHQLYFGRHSPAKASSRVGTADFTWALPSINSQSYHG